ncbi:MAG TPA: NUDIX hydrolase [Chroococcidiopsis sp.]
MAPTARLRVSVVGLFVDRDEVLLIHQMTPPEPDCWDLPGGGLAADETLLDGLSREVREETGLESFQVDRLLTVLEDFFPEGEGKLLHALNIVYQCSVLQRPERLSSDDPEIGPNGIQWLAIADLTPEQCSKRSWRALQAAGLIE